MDSDERPGDKRAESRCFTGKLDQMPLPEVLNFLSVSGKTGKLSLTRRDGHGLIVLRGGRIIYAGSSSVRVTLGNIMVCRGLISEAVLTEALERQHFAEEEIRLGGVLVEMGAVSPEDVVEVVKYQTGLVLSELCQWTAGFFKFDTMSIPESGEIEVDAKDFVVTGGLSTDGLLLKVLAQLDESQRDAAEEMAASAGSGAEEEAPESVSLDRILADLPAPALRGEITLMLMRFAARIVGRGILFAVRGDMVAAISYFGFDGAEISGSSMTRKLQVSLLEPSVFAEVVQKKETWRGAIDRSPVHERFLRQLGGEPPTEAVVIPMIVAGNAAMIFYGDDRPLGRPLGEIRPLELVMTEAGLEMEKDALEGRIKKFERSRRRAEFLNALLGQETKGAPVPPVTLRSSE
jgi:hypothetical protein